MTTPRLRVGVIGLGRAFTVMLPTFRADTRVVLAGGADPDPAARARFEHDFGVPAYASAEELCADNSVQAVYVATPHQFHADHACLAAAYGKHVLVEKPMALSIEECDRMITAAASAGVRLIVGPTHGFDKPVLHARNIIETGMYGDVRMVTAVNYTDFVYRPRRPEEFVTELGGGVVHNQAAHQIDVIRLLAGHRVRSVRAHVGAWDEARPMQGAYSALLVFETGAYASAVYSGYAHYDTDVLMDNVSESGRPKSPNGYGLARKRLREVEIHGGEARARGGEPQGTSAADAPWYPHFGHVIVSCQHADLRPTPKGVAVYEDAQRWFDPLPQPSVPRAEVITELYDCVFNDAPPRHSGEWARATTEVCLAIVASAREGREKYMKHQTIL